MRNAYEGWYRSFEFFEFPHQFLYIRRGDEWAIMYFSCAALASANVSTSSIEGIEVVDLDWMVLSTC